MAPHFGPAPPPALGVVEEPPPAGWLAHPPFGSGLAPHLVQAPAERSSQSLFSRPKNDGAVSDALFSVGARGLGDAAASGAARDSPRSRAASFRRLEKRVMMTAPFVETALAAPMAVSRRLSEE